MKKRILSLALCVCMIAGLFSGLTVTVGAETVASGTCGDNLTWVLDGGTLTISGTGAMTDWEWNGSPWYNYRSSIKTVVIESGVTSIGNNAFYGLSNITSITIPEGVKRIGYDALRDCAGLTSISLPSSLTDIDGVPFTGCSALEFTVYDNAKYLGNSENPYLLLSFATQYDITSCEIHEGTRFIGGNAFAHCTELETVTIPDSVTSIEYYAFYNCAKLESVKLGSGVRDVGYGVFMGCDALEFTEFVHGTYLGTEENPYQLYVGTTETDAKNLGLQDGTKAIATGALKDCENLENIILPASLEYIGTSAFLDCDELENVYFEGTKAQWGNIVIEENNENLKNANIVCVNCRMGYCNEKVAWVLRGGVLTFIGAGDIPDYNWLGAPWNDLREDITSVVISEGITGIGMFAFGDCTELTSVSLPESLTKIGYGAFQSCKKLPALEIPASVEEIAELAFNDFYGEVTIDEDNESFKMVDGVLFTFDGTELVWYPLNKEDASYTVPEGVTALRPIAFVNNKYVERITLPASLTSMHDNSFYGKFKALTEISVAAGNGEFCSVDGVLYNKDKTTLMRYPHAKDGAYVIEPTVTQLYGYAFAHASKLTEVTIPAGVMSIGYEAFNGCTALSDVYYGSTQADWNDIAVSEGNEKLQEVSVHFTETTSVASGECGDNLTWELLGDGTLTIRGTGDMANYEKKADVPWGGYSASVKRVVIESGVTGVGDRAFFDCVNMKTVSIPEGVTRIGRSAFEGCRTVKEIALPASVEEIGIFAFNVTYTLVRVAEGSEFFKVEDDVLYTKDGTELVWYPSVKTDDEFEVPEGVVKIRNSAISNNTYLEELSLPASLTTVGPRSIYGKCVNLMWIFVSEDNETFTSEDGMLYTKNKATLIRCPQGKEGALVVPNGVNWIYSGALRSCQKITMITLPESLVQIYPEAFVDCPALTDVYFVGTAEQWAEVEVLENNTALSGATMHFGEFAGGKCGENVAWSLGPDGTLTISGTGAMANYLWSDDAPWYAFSGDIKNIVICEGVTSVGNSAFEDCWNLESVTLPEGLKRIGFDAFHRCENLKTINIPSSVTEIGSLPFNGCYALEYNVYGNAKYLGNDENPYLLLVKAANEDITSCVIHAQTKFIGTSAFDGCEALTEITIPDSVTDIGDWAFSDCSALTSVSLGSGLEHVGSYVFLNCDKLEHEEYKYGKFIGNEENPYLLFYEVVDDTQPAYAAHKTTELISPSVFNTCEDMLMLGLSKSIKRIEHGTFFDTPSLEMVFYAGTEEQWNALEIGGENESLDEARIVFGSHAGGFCGEDLYWVLNFDGELRIIGDDGYIPNYDSPSKVPWYQLRDEITSIVIEEGVYWIGWNAFHGLYNVTSVSLPESLEGIYNSAFQGCRSLESITIPAAVEEIWPLVFDQAPVTITIAEGNESFKMVDGVLYTKDGTELVWYPSIKTDASFAIPEGVTVAREGAFTNNHYLQSVSLPASLVTVSSQTFYGIMPRLNEITVAEGNEKYTSLDGALYLKDGLVLIRYPNARTVGIVPDGVTRIGWYAFAWCRNMTSVALPASVTEISDGAFLDCRNLVNVFFKGTGAQWDTLPVGVDNEALKKAVVYVDVAVGQCGEDLCWLLDVDSLAVFGTGDMWDFAAGDAPWREVIESVTEIYVDSRVTSIGAWAFDGCANATSATINKDVATIGEHAFNGCTALTDVNYEGTRVQWYAIEIDDGNEDLTNATIHFTEPAYVLGDVDGDGKINTVDASLALRFYVDVANYPLDEVQQLAADMDKNGVVNAVDANMILKHYVGTCDAACPLH